MFDALRGRPVVPLKGHADGLCNWCGGDVPASNTNMFYCSEPCRQSGWNYHHPGQ